MEPPILTVVVTTKDRPSTALLVVRTILEWPDEQFELVVQDCSAGSALEGELQKISDPRLRYVHTAPVDMTSNWNAALARATGQYVIVIGDDDGIDDRIVNLARWARREGVDAVIYPLSMYFWPDFSDTALASHVYVPTWTGEVRFVGNVSAKLERLSHGWGIRYDWRRDRTQLPELYHGLVRRELLERHARATGAFVSSYCPDIYASYVLATLTERFAIIDYPYSISGKCGASNSSRMRSGQYDPHLNEYGAESKWLPVLPQAHNLLVILADTMLKALADVRPALQRNVDLADIYALCAVQSPRDGLRLADMLGRNIRQMGRSRIRAYGRFSWRVAGRGMRSMLRAAQIHASAPMPESAYLGTAPDVRGALALQRQRDTRGPAAIE